MTKPAKRERTQLTIQASPDLLAKVRQMAEQRRQTVTAVVVEALEAWIAGDQIFSTGDDDDLRRRVEALEREVIGLLEREVLALGEKP